MASAQLKSFIYFFVSLPMFFRKYSRHRCRSLSQEMRMISGRFWNRELNNQICFFLKTLLWYQSCFSKNIKKVWEEEEKVPCSACAPWFFGKTAVWIAVSLRRSLRWLSWCWGSDRFPALCRRIYPEET